jgi:hypothetical protein
MDFALAKEQVALSLLIQEGRRELDALKAEKDTFIQEREVEASARVTKALEASKDAVKETDRYVETVEGMIEDAQQIAKDIKISRTTLQEERREFARMSETARLQLDGKGKELELFSTKVQVEKMKLDGVVAELNLARSALAREQQIITNDRAKLKAALTLK